MEFDPTRGNAIHYFIKYFSFLNTVIMFFCLIIESYTSANNLDSSSRTQTKSASCFIYIPLQQQITTLLLSDTKLYSHLTNRNLEISTNCNTVADVTTSALYKQLITKQGSNDMSLTWNTDGIPIFNSSNFSIWPYKPL